MPFRNKYGGSIKEIRDKVGMTDILDTTAQSIVGAINEVNSGKVDKIDGKGLSTNDYTDTDKSKVELIGDTNISHIGNSITAILNLLNDNKLNYNIVDTLPQSVDNNTLYFLKTYDADYDPIDNSSAMGYKTYFPRASNDGSLVWVEIGNKDIIGDLAELQTTNKSTIVSAINEIRSTGGACTQAQRYYDLGVLIGTITDGVLTVVYNGDLLDLSTRTKIDFVINVNGTWTKTAINLVANDMTLTLENSNGNRNIGSNDIAVTGQVTIYVDDTRYIDGDPVPTYSLRNSGSSGTNVTFNGDLSGNEISQTVVGINGISTTVQSIANGQLLGYNSDTNKIIPVDINVSGIVGNSVIKQAGSDVVLESGGEATFHHTQAEHKVIDVYEVVDGDTIVDSTIDFGDSEKYLFENAKLKNGTVKMESGGIDEDTVLMLEFDNNLTDKSLSPKTISVVTSSISYNATDKKIGTHSAYFNKNVYLQTPSLADFELKNGDFTIDFWAKFDANSGTSTVIASSNYDWGNNVGFLLNRLNSNSIALSMGKQWNITSPANTVLKNIWYFIKIIRRGSNCKICINGEIVVEKDDFIPYGGTTNRLYVGYTTAGDTSYKMSGYIDNLRITKRVTDPHEMPIMPFSNAYNISDPSNIKTTWASNFSLTEVDKFTSIDISHTIPADTNIKCLISFDSRQSWHWYDGAEWVTYTNNLSENWTNSNTPDEIEGYFENLTKAQLIDDLDIKGINPISLDFAFQLSTTDSTKTPTLDGITITYDTTDHLEKAWCGGIRDASDFGVIIVNDTSYTVKNKTASPRKIKTYITTAESE